VSVEPPSGITCAVPWSACANCFTGIVASSAGTDRCLRCGREWPSPPPRAPCGRPATHMVTDRQGESGLVCDAHAAIAEKRLVGAKIRKLSIDRKEIDL
jgi:hypothetical protein